MTKNIIILVVLAVGIFALVLFYKQSSFELTSNSLILKTKQNGVVYPYQEIKKDKQSFSNIDIVQYTLTSNGEKIIYEVATIDGLYEFNNNLKMIISKLFDTKDSKSLFTHRGLEALQLTLVDGQKLNLFLVQTDSKKIEFLYGLSDKLFAKSLKQLSGKVIKTENSTLITEPLTKWSIKVNEIDGVINSIDH